jgi:hypothetical protein
MKKSMPDENNKLPPISGDRDENDSRTLVQEG